jgi:hypothetical protein
MSLGRARGNLMAWRFALLLSVSGTAPCLADPFVPRWAPWFSDQLMWQWTSEVATIGYRPWCGCDHQWWWGLASGMGLAPTESIEVQGQLAIAQRSDTSVYGDIAQLCGRWGLLNDLSGDPLSAVTALTVTFGSRDAVRAVAEFVPSDVNGELSLALGREWSRCERWLARAWALGAVGIANEGRPWVRGSLHVDLQPWACTELLMGVEAIQTFGEQRAWGCVFPGYAHVRASWVDLQLSAATSRWLGGRLGLELRSRLWAKRAPKPWTLGGLLFTYAYSF